MRRARAGALRSVPAPRRGRARRRRRRRLRDEAQVHNEPRRAGGRGGGGREAVGDAALRRLRAPAGTRGFAARYGAPFCGSRPRPLSRRRGGAGAARRAERGALPQRDGSAVPRGAREGRGGATPPRGPHWLREGERPSPAAGGGQGNGNKGRGAGPGRGGRCAALTAPVPQPRRSGRARAAPEGPQMKCENCTKKVSEASRGGANPLGRSAPRSAGPQAAGSRAVPCRARPWGCGSGGALRAVAGRCLRSFPGAAAPPPRGETRNAEREKWSKWVSERLFSL